MIPGPQDPAPRIMISALTFDLDDTLWDTPPVIRRAEAVTHAWLARQWPAVARHFDVAGLAALRRQVAEEDPDRAHDLTLMRFRTYRRAAEAAGYPPEAVARGAFAVFYRERNRVELFPDVLPVLEPLARRLPLAAVSNGNADIQAVGLGHVFRLAVSAREVGRPKPDPLIWKEACRRLGVMPRTVVHVGDHPEHDVAGARAAGLRTVWLNRRGVAWSGPGCPDAEIPDLSALPAVLARWGVEPVAGSGGVAPFPPRE